jgi:multidrug resistance efflux pump
MKRAITIVVILVLGGSLAAGWWWARTSPEQATQFLVSGGLETGRAEEFITMVGGQAQVEEEQAFIASGSIEGEEVAIVSEFGGRIVRLGVEEGDDVEAGQVLVELDTRSLQAEIARAEAAVAAAKANLTNVRAGTHPAEILAAEALLLQAKSERDAAQTAVRDAQVLLDNPQAIEAQVVQAQAARDLAETQIEQAEARIASAEVERDQYRGQGSMEEKWLYKVHNYQVEAAKVGLAAARANAAGAKQTFAALQALRANPLALVSQVHLAEAQYDIAEAGVAVAEARLAELKAGPAPEEVAVAEAQIAQAQAAVSALQAQVEKMTLQAPISGIVSSRSAHAGEAAIAGATLLTLADLDEVRLTIYIPEDELGRVFLGQEAAVQVDSFPHRVFPGTVSYISQRAEFTPKNVQTEKERVNMVFAVKVRLPNEDHLLKPGMPADAILTANSGS